MSVVKQVLGIAGAILVLGAGYLAYDRFASAQRDNAVRTDTAQSPAAARVEIAAAESHRVERRVEAVGSTVSRQAIEIVANASGRVQELTFEPGQTVAAGQALARLDDDIERADLTEARARLREVQLALQRARQLRASGTVTQANLDQLIGQEATTQAALDRAERRLADRVVRAPFAGVVGLRRIDPGARINEGTPITTLDDRSAMAIEFSLPETLYGQVQPDQPVTATSAAFPGRRFTGRVTAIDSRIDQTARAFRVRAHLPNPDLTLPSGMFMHLALTLDERDAVLIPEEAVMFDGHRISVFVVNGDRAQRRVVRLGQREVGTVEVVEGLQPGEKVVIRGLQRLRDGARVEVIGKAAPPAGDEPAGQRGGGPV